MTKVRRILTELILIRRIGGWSCLTRYSAAVALTLPEILRTGNLSSADNNMAGKRREFRVCDRKVSLDGALFSAAREIYGRQVYFALPEFSINATDTVVDLGANAGVFTVLAALLGKRVISVEAQSRFLDDLAVNARANNCAHKIVPELALVGSRSGIFSDPRRLTTASHFAQQPPTYSMTDIIGRHRLDAISFLKIDIEGSEFDLLTHDNDWLAIVDKIAMEVHADYGDIGSLVSLLENKGFKVWLIDNEQRPAPNKKNANGYLFALRHQARRHVKESQLDNLVAAR